MRVLHRQQRFLGPPSGRNSAPRAFSLPLSFFGFFLLVRLTRLPWRASRKSNGVGLNIPYTAGFEAERMPQIDVPKWARGTSLSDVDET